MTALSAELRRLNACREAVEWAKPYATLQEAWAACHRPDWMLWLLGARGTHREEVRQVAYWCANRATASAVDALRSAGLHSAADTLASVPPVVNRDTADTAGRAAYAAGRAAHAAGRAAYAAGSAAYAETCNHIRSLVPDPDQGGEK